MKTKLKHNITFIFIIVNLMLLTGCFAGEDDGDSGGGSSSSSSSSSSSAPTTTFDASDDAASCVVSNGKYNCNNGVAQVTLTAAGSTIYYAANIGSTPTVTTDSSSDTSPAVINFTGSDQENLYIRYFAVDSSGTESTKEAIIYFIDSTDPVSSILTARLATDASNDCVLIGTEYTCDGPATITLTADEAATICYSTDGVAPTCVPSVEVDESGVSTGFSITTAGTNLQFYAKDKNEYTANNTEATVHSYDFQINNVSTSNINCSGSTTLSGGGYCNSAVSFQLEKSADASYSKYQIWYKLVSDPDVSSDSSSDSVFTGNPPLSNGSTRYYGNYVDEDIDSEILITPSDTYTRIYQYRYNILHDGTYESSTDSVPDGTSDSDGHLVFYLDVDKPHVNVIPPSQGTLNSSLQVMPYIQDPGHDKVARYAASNSVLSAAAPLQSVTPYYCQIAKSVSGMYEDTAGFWDNCAPAINSASSPISIATDSYIGVYGQDKAGNQSECEFDKQYSCLTSAPVSTDTDILEDYLVEQMQTSESHANNEDITQYANFGHVVLTGDLSSDNIANDIIISAPGYSYTSATDTSADQGAVYIWFDEFRERAQVKLALGDATMDVSGDVWLNFATDGGTSLKVNLDPDYDETSLMLSSDYNDKSAASAYEIASILNRAFLNSFGSNGNHLFAVATDSTGNLLTNTLDASTDGYITIGHINRTIQGYFTIDSNGFDASSDFNLSSRMVRAYDYAIFGESDDDEFGYSVALEKIDTSSDTSSYSQKQLVIGAPGYSNHTGAVYIIKIPAEDATNDSMISLDSGLPDYVHRIVGTSTAARLGTSFTFFDHDSDGYKDILVSAPYLDASADDGGGVFRFSERDYDFEATTDTTSDISSASDSVIGDSTDDLLGYSMVIGKSRYLSGISENRLFIGAPGKRSIGSLGRVKIYRLSNANINTGYILDQQEYYQSVPNLGNLFGYSLLITDSNFDTNNACPCLMVGAPGNQSKGGKVWIYGQGLETYIESTDDYDHLGISLLSGYISSTGYKTIFIGSNNNSLGKLIALDRQSITSGLTTAGMSAKNPFAFAGINNGQNYGSSIAIYENSSGVKALLIGSPGENYLSSYTYYRNGIDYYMRGSIDLILANKLGF